MNVVAGGRYLPNLSSVVFAGVLLVCCSVNRKGVDSIRAFALNLTEWCKKSRYGIWYKLYCF